MKNSILIIGMQCQFEEDELLKAIKKAGHHGQILDLAQINIQLSAQGAELFYGTSNITTLFKRSRIIFRRSRGAQEKMITLSLLATAWKIPFTDSVQSIMSNLSKAMFMPLIHSKIIRHIPTYFWPSGDTPVALPKWHFPLLTKPIHGRHGEGVRLIKTATVLKSFLAKNKISVMIQPFLKITAEYRILVVGKKALGVIQKIRPRGSLVANYTAGAKFIKATLPPAIVQEAITICTDQGITIGGVDIAKVSSAYYLLEVNRCPEFQAFAKATGIDVAKEVINLFFKNKTLLN